MFDALTIGGAVSGLKAAGDILKTMIGLRDAGMIDAKVMELNAVILAAQQSALTAQKEQIALQEEVTSLRRRLTEFEQRGSERDRYRRTDMGGGGIAYTLKELREGETDQPVCANCFEQGHISTLQTRNKHRGLTYMRCPACENLFKFGVEEEPPPERPIGPSWGRLSQARRGYGRK